MSVNFGWLTFWLHSGGGWLRLWDRLIFSYTTAPPLFSERNGHRKPLFAILGRRFFLLG